MAGVHIVMETGAGVASSPGTNIAGISVRQRRCSDGGIARNTQFVIKAANTRLVSRLRKIPLKLAFSSLAT